MELQNPEEINFSSLEVLLSKEPELRKPSELKLIQDELLKFRFFQELKRDYHINNIVDCSIYFKYIQFTPGDVVFSIFQPAVNFYILLKGKISIYKNNEEIRYYTEGVIEECCLVERRKYDTSAVSIHESHVIYIDYQIYFGVFAKIREKRRIAMVSFLQIQEYFKNWTKARIMGISYFIHELEVSKGFKIFNLYESADRVFIVQDGSVVLKNDKIQILFPGEMIGIEDIQKNRCRTAECISQSKTNLLYIFKHDFLDKSWPRKKESTRVTNSLIETFSFNKKDHGLSISSFMPERNNPVKIYGVQRLRTGNVTRSWSSKVYQSESGFCYTYRQRNNSLVRPFTTNLPRGFNKRQQNSDACFKNFRKA